MILTIRRSTRVHYHYKPVSKSSDAGESGMRWIVKTVDF